MKRQPTEKKHTFASNKSDKGFTHGTSGKESTCQCRRCKRQGFDPWVGKITERRAWQLTQCSYLQNPMGRGAWWAAVHGVVQSEVTLPPQTILYWSFSWIVLFVSNLHGKNMGRFRFSLSWFLMHGWGICHVCSKKRYIHQTKTSPHHLLKPYKCL